MSLKLLIILGLLGLQVSISAQADSAGRLLRGTDLQNVSVLQATQGISAGDIVVIGEEHGSAMSQDGQLKILRAIRARGLRVSVGMEFLEYPFQVQVDQFRAGTLPESDFLSSVGWGLFSFDFYREQILFPLAAEGGRTVALNIPRAITSQVAKKGFASLTPEQQRLLPPRFARGNNRYFERFKNAVGGHLPDEAAAERYFLAQSLWDETMAWQSIQALQADPNQVLVIIVGEFHVQYGGGLPDRLKARGARQVWTFSEINLEGLTEQERLEQLQPHAIDGARADYLWIWEPEAPIRK